MATSTLIDLLEKALADETPDSLGQRAGVSGQTIRNWRRGYGVPSHRHTSGLARALGISVEKLAAAISRQVEKGAA